MLAAATAVQSQTVSYTGALQFSSGSYIFAQRTNSLYFSNGISVSAGRLDLSASLPLISQSTPWISYGGAGMIPSGGPQHMEVGRGMFGRRKVFLQDTTDYAAVGLGDPILHAGLELVKESGAIPSILLGLDVKIPVADVDHGFGTGEWDYGAGLSLTKTLEEGSFFVVSMSYWVLGDMPGLRLKDALAYRIALVRPLPGGRMSWIASFSGYSEILADVEPPAHVTLGINYRLNPRTSLNGSAAMGVTETSADFSLSLGWQVGL
jgi:hypothetical protein